MGRGVASSETGAVEPLFFFRHPIRMLTVNPHGMIYPWTESMEADIPDIPSVWLGTVFRSSSGPWPSVEGICTVRIISIAAR